MHSHIESLQGMECGAASGWAPGDLEENPYPFIWLWLGFGQNLPRNIHVSELCSA